MEMMGGLLIAFVVIVYLYVRGIGKALEFFSASIRKGWRKGGGQ
jgi:hypothetical protein